jgi:hypothetical protein
MSTRASKNVHGERATQNTIAEFGHALLPREFIERFGYWRETETDNLAHQSDEQDGTGWEFESASNEMESISDPDDSESDGRESDCERWQPHDIELPFPVSTNQETMEQYSQFLDNLRALENCIRQGHRDIQFQSGVLESHGAMVATRTRLQTLFRGYLGSSSCRLCPNGTLNGSQEYEVHSNVQRLHIAWPEGLIHYYHVHHVEPDAAFMRIVNELVAIPELMSSTPQ